MPLQLLDNRYRDYVGFPPLLRSGENDGKSFSDFYRASQMELFSALDNVLSQKAEDTLNQFAAVKKADIQLQTPLGNRKAQIGINIMGAFAESQSSAFGWQVRAFGGKDNIGGANVGVFFRRLENEWLYGLNVFADYESGDYGDFLRYGIGGELQNPFSALAVNYYLPITDDKRQGATVAFSQKGYDANLRINIPRLDFLKLRADYYLFDGKYGGEDDKGFRYGLEVQPINDLRIGVFYDDGGEKFGGDIAYTYNFGIPQKRESKVAFSPDLFTTDYDGTIGTATAIYHNGNFGYDGNNHNSGKGFYNSYNNGGNDDNNVSDKHYNVSNSDGKCRGYSKSNGRWSIGIYCNTLIPTCRRHSRRHRQIQS